MVIGVDQNNSGINVAAASLPDGTENTTYPGFTFLANGGTGALTFSATGLPIGLTVDAAGFLSGTPVQAGTFNVDVTATDTLGCSGHRSYPLDIVAVCLFCDDFEDGILSGDWTYLQQSWSESNGNLIGVPTRKKTSAIAQPAFGGCANCRIRATMQTNGGKGNLVTLLGWYADERNRLELLMKEEKNKWLLKERINGRVVRKVKGIRDILPDVNYTVELIFTGTTYQLTVDGELVLELTPQGSHSGTVGFEAKATTATIGEVSVN